MLEAFLKTPLPSSLQIFYFEKTDDSKDLQFCIILIKKCTFLFYYVFYFIFVCLFFTCSSFCSFLQANLKWSGGKSYELRWNNPIKQEDFRCCTHNESLFLPTKKKKKMPFTTQNLQLLSQIFNLITQSSEKLILRNTKKWLLDANKCLVGCFFLWQKQASITNHWCSKRGRKTGKR